MAQEAQQGLFEKFHVERIDGQPEKEGAKYFTLDYHNDPHARVALQAYADSARRDNPALAADLDDELIEYIADPL